MEELKQNDKPSEIQTEPNQSENIQKSIGSSVKNILYAGIDRNNEGFQESYYTGENGEKIFLTINGKNRFKRIQINKSCPDGKPKNGIVMIEENVYQYFYLDEKSGKYLVLEIEGEDKFSNILSIELNDEGIPVWGKIDVDGETREFYGIGEGFLWIPEEYTK